MTETSILRAAWQELLADSRLAELTHAGAGVSMHLVGGAVRDAALGLPGLAIHDLDIVVADGGRGIAERFAAATGARMVALGGERFAALRLVSGGKHLDLWDLRGGSLTADLWRRDFTVNAIALAVPGGEIVDPTGGIADLAAHRLRATREQVFAEDPVRVLRLARLAVTLPGFHVDPATTTWARAAAPQLAAAPHERVRVELEFLLSQPQLSAAAHWIEALDLAPLLFGKGHVLPASVASSRRAAERLDRWREAQAPGRQVPSGLSVLPPSDLAPLALHWTLLAELLTTSREPTASVLRDLRGRGLMTGASCAAALGLLVPAWEPPEDETSRRRWLHTGGTLWREAIALRAALPECSDQREAWRTFESGLLALPDDERNWILSPPGLISGDEVQLLLGIAPGPEVGAALARVRQGQVEGIVRTREEAEALLQGKRPSP